MRPHSQRLRRALEQAAVRAESQTGGWQLTLHELAHATRSAVMQHPEEFSALVRSSEDYGGPRPTMRVTAWVEAVLHALLGDGFPAAVVPDAYRAFASFVLGHALVIVAETAQVSSSDEHELVEAATTSTHADRDLTSRPVIVALRVALSRPQSLHDFDDGLEGVVDRLSRMRKESREGVASDAD